jgi:hypothetical protein
MKSTTLKNKNRYRLIIVVAANIVAFLVIRKYYSAYELMQLFESTGWKSLASALVPTTILGIIISLLGGMLSDLQKARLIFWRWSHPLPGCRAFEVHAYSDPRVDVQELRRLVKPWPKTPADQNNAWYKLYKTVSSDTVVVYQHQEYLFMRDWASMALIALPFVGISLWFSAPFDLTLLLTVGALALQYLIVRLAACNYAVRFITAVLCAVTTKS